MEAFQKMLPEVLVQLCPKIREGLLGGASAWKTELGSRAWGYSYKSLSPPGEKMIGD